MKKSFVLFVLLFSQASQAGLREWVQIAHDFWAPKVTPYIEVAENFWCVQKLPTLCSSIRQVPVPLKKGFDAYSNWALHRMGKISQSGKTPESVRGMVDYYAEVFKDSNNTALKARATRLLNKIRSNAGDTRMSSCYTVTVLASEKMNAFNTGCHIYITEGIMQMFPDDKELTSVLAHEMSHGDQGHAVKNILLLAKSLGTHLFLLIDEETKWLMTGEIGENLAAVMAEGNLPVFLGIYGEAAPQVELAADVGAVVILEKSGISRSALKTSLIKLHQAMGMDVETVENYDSLRDYPSLRRRLEAIDSVRY